MNAVAEVSVTEFLVHGESPVRQSVSLPVPPPSMAEVHIGSRGPTLGLATMTYFCPCLGTPQTRQVEFFA